MKQLLVFTIFNMCLAGCASQPEQSVTVFFLEPVVTPTEEESQLFFVSQGRIISSIAMAQRVASVLDCANYSELRSRVNVDIYPEKRSIVISVSEMPSERNALAIAKIYAEQYRIWHEGTDTVRVRGIKRMSGPPSMAMRETVVTNNLYPVIERIVLNDGRAIWDASRE